MKVIVTGAQGFIGKNLVAWLKECQDINVIEFDKDDKFSIIEDCINSVGFIFHLAGINRPESVDDYYLGNSDFTKQLVNCLEMHNYQGGLLMSSSIHANEDTDYGKSKQKAEEYIFKSNLPNAYIYRLSNVFGKWCKPNYNSVIATFCHNIANDLPIKVEDPNTVIHVNYIDDVVKSFIRVMQGINPVKIGTYCIVNPIYDISLGELAKLLYSFRNDMNSLDLPRTGDDFTKDLFSTYISYCDESEMVMKLKPNDKPWGNFTELMHTGQYGQISSSIIRPGNTRGNHYHHTKVERFIVIKGKARINLRSISGTKITSYEVSGDLVDIITIPPGYTHNITNIGEEDLVYIIWCNEEYDSNHPDTYHLEV